MLLPFELARSHPCAETHLPLLQESLLGQLGRVISLDALR